MVFTEESHAKKDFWILGTTGWALMAIALIRMAIHSPSHGFIVASVICNVVAAIAHFADRFRR